MNLTRPVKYVCESSYSANEGSAWRANMRAEKLPHSEMSLQPQALDGCVFAHKKASKKGKGVRISRSQSKSKS
jgi:hypothetical protein